MKQKSLLHMKLASAVYDRCYKEGVCIALDVILPAGPNVNIVTMEARSIFSRYALLMEKEDILERVISADENFFVAHYNYLVIPDLLQDSVFENKYLTSMRKQGGAGLLIFDTDNNKIIEKDRARLHIIDPVNAVKLAMSMVEAMHTV